jgi:septum formation protein
MILILASASPRRAELLRAAGFEFEVRPACADETVHPGELPDRYVRRVAESKAQAVLPGAGDRPVIAADTVVVVDGRILGKPVDAEDAAAMLRALSGRRHQVLTGVTVAVRASDSGEPGGIRQLTSVETTDVDFAPLTEAEIRWYVASGEPADKAGAYAVQGLASRFARRVEGSYANVVGLPVALVYRMLAELGYA